MQELQAALSLLRQLQDDSPAAGQKVEVTWVEPGTITITQPDPLGDLAARLSIYRRSEANPLVLAQVWEHIQLFLLEVLAGTCPDFEIVSTSRRVIDLILEELEHRAEVLSASAATKAELRDLRVRQLFSAEPPTLTLRPELWENLQLPERKL